MKPSGCGMPTLSKAAATTGQDSGSGQYPVDWLVTSVTRTSPPPTSNVISPAESTSPPRAQATCSECRSAIHSEMLTSTTKVATKIKAFRVGCVLFPQAKTSAFLLTRVRRVVSQPNVFRSHGPMYWYTASDPYQCICFGDYFFQYGDGEAANVRRVPCRPIQTLDLIRQYHAIYGVSKRHRHLEVVAFCPLCDWAHDRKPCGVVVH